jgi:hypothetical protein
MLSLPKILLFLAVIVVVVVVSKALRGRSAKAVAKDEDKDKALDLEPCPVCGNYVAAAGGGCERGDCPIAKG